MASEAGPGEISPPTTTTMMEGEAEACIVQAVQGFLRTIALGMSSSSSSSTITAAGAAAGAAADPTATVTPSSAASSVSASCVAAVVLQDTLRLLTLWFAHGARPAVHAAVEKGRCVRVCRVGALSVPVGSIAD